MAAGGGVAVADNPKEQSPSRQDGKAEETESEPRPTEPVEVEILSTDKTVGVATPEGGELVAAVEAGPSDVEIEGLDPVAASYAKKLAHVSMVLAAREEKILTMTTELDGKRETHNVLHSQVELLEQQLQSNYTGKIEELTGEFTERLGSVEGRLKEIVRERDALKEQLDEATTRFSNRIGETDKLSGELLAEKDAKIDSLMAEGQKLQKKNFESGQRNKKLQAKLKEADANIKQLDTRLMAAQDRTATLEKELEELRIAEAEYKQSANQVSAVQGKQSKELAEVKKNEKALKEKNEGLQAALESAHKHKEDLEKQLAEEAVKASNAVAAADSAAKAAMKSELKKMEDGFEQSRGDFHAQITDLRTALKREETKSARREANLQQEILDLNERLRHAEQREQQLTESMSQTTKPLMRQIDMLRASLADQTASHDVAEATLTNRLEEALATVAAAEERERVALERLGDARSQSVSYDEKLSALRTAKLDQQAKLERQLERNDELEMELHKMQQQTKALQATFDGASEEWRKERIKLKTVAADTLKAREDEWEREKADLQHRVKTAPLGTGGEASTVAPNISMGKGAGDASIDVATNKPDVAAISNDVGGAGASVAGVVERLNARILHKDSELQAIRRQLQELQTSRNAIADELVILVSKNEVLQKECDSLPDITAKLSGAEAKLDAVMQMYGEKAEEADELRLDLQDFRSLYQAQTESLVGQIEQLSVQVAAKREAAGK